MGVKCDKFPKSRHGFSLIAMVKNSNIPYSSEKSTLAQKLSLKSDTSTVADPKIKQIQPANLTETCHLRLKERLIKPVSISGTSIYAENFTPRWQNYAGHCP